jgi:hypothetical protein
MSVQTEDRRRRRVSPRRPAGAASVQSRSDRRRDSQIGIDERIEISFALLAMNNTRYLKRFEEDGIEFRSGLATHIISAVNTLNDTAENGIHCVDPELITHMLDPDEESRFRRYAGSIRIGADDEAFYRETRSSYLINNYKMEKAELLNELAIAEKTGRQDDIEELAARLIRLDNLINKTNQTMEERNA